jgi:serine protease DegQ
MLPAMRRAPVHRPSPSRQPEPPVVAQSDPVGSVQPTAKRLSSRQWKGFVLLWVVAGLLGGWGGSMWPTTVTRLAQEDIDAAVLHTLQTQNLPSRSARAAAVIAPSVVMVRGFRDAPTGPDNANKKNRPAGQDQRADVGRGNGKGKGQDETENGVGTGVVVKDDGTIMTNFHVVSGSTRLEVTFMDGTQSPAVVVGVRPESDLAIIKPQKIPDDLVPAVLAGSGDLQPGDEVVAVGFPFGIGPSVSAGVVSGLGREFQVSENQVMRGLIQFDAAANPGNSGGPLVNMAGEVVGIVTAILNPTRARTFIGIGFATTIESAGAAVGIPPF